MSALPVLEPLAAAVPAARPRAPLRPVRSETDAWAGPQPTSTCDLPEAHAWVTSMAQAITEAMAGSRAATQLLRWMEPGIHERVARRSRLAARTRAQVQPAAVRSVRVCHVADGVVEAAAVLHLNGRVRALALRLEGRDGRWVVTELEMG